MAITFRALTILGFFYGCFLKASEPVFIKQRLQAIDIGAFKQLDEIGAFNLQLLNSNELAKKGVHLKAQKIKVTEPFGLDKNQTFPWESAEKVIIGLLYKKSGGKRERNLNGKQTPYFYYSLEVDPLIILRGEKQLSLQTRKKSDLRSKVSNALDKISKEIENPSTFNAVKSQSKLDELLQEKNSSKTLPNDLKYVRASYNGIHEVEPPFPKDNQLVFIALTGTSSTKKLAYWEGINVSNFGLIRRQLGLPYGWTLDKEGKPLSPWSDYGEQSHMGEEKSLIVCAKSERGFTPADKGLVFSVNKIPSEFIQNNYANRDGDGFFSLTLRNSTDFPLSIPSLRKTQRRILWKESLACLVSASTSSNSSIKNSICLPEFPSVKDLGKTDPTILKPGQEISTTVNPLLFKNFPKLVGLSQLNLRFCLGKKVALTSFYYNSNYHDKIKLRIRAGLPTRPIRLGD